jgi:DNA polymerase-3 subunit alpha
VRESGQGSLFDMLGQGQQAAFASQELEGPDVPLPERLAWEKELLGVYVSEHPFARAAAALAPHLSCLCAEVTAEMAGRDVIVAGVVSHTRSLLTRDGRAFLAAEIEDLSGTLELTVWPETYEQTKDLWEQGQIVAVSARLRSRGDRLTAAVQRVQIYEEGQTFDPSELVTANGGNGGRNNGGYNGQRSQPPPRAAQRKPNGGSALRIVLEETGDSEGDHERLRSLIDALRDFQGEGKVHLAIRQRDGDEVELELPSARYCPELSQRLGEIVGDWGRVSL